MDTKSLVFEIEFMRESLDSHLADIVRYTSGCSATVRFYKRKLYKKMIAIGATWVVLTMIFVGIVYRTDMFSNTGFNTFVLFLQVPMLWFLLTRSRTLIRQYGFTALDISQDKVVARKTQSAKYPSADYVIILEKEGELPVVYELYNKTSQGMIVHVVRTRASRQLIDLVEVTTNKI